MYKQWTLLLLVALHVPSYSRQHVALKPSWLCSAFYSLVLCLQCFDTVGWASGRASGLYKLSDEVLVWLSVWSEVQIVCIWSSRCHCIPKPHHLLPHLNPDWFYLSGTDLQLVAWHSGRTSVSGRRTFPVLRSTCSWWVTTIVGKPSAIGQPTRPTQPFILSGSIKWVVSWNQMCAAVYR